MEQDNERTTLRALLALIILADLPVPTGYRLGGDPGTLTLSLSGIADGAAWAAHLGALPLPMGDGKVWYLNSDGNRYLRVRPVKWHGWQVHLWASAPNDEATAELGDLQAARLRKVAGIRPGCADDALLDAHVPAKP